MTGDSIMKVFMIGGTGLLGSEGAKELIKRGYEVSSIALPPIPTGANLPKEMKLTLGNYLELSDDELKRNMTGCQGFVFAAGVDERVEGPPPIYDMFYKYNIAPLKRLLTIAKSCGVKHAVVLGSYFAYFNRVWPHLELTKHHPYIRSRVDQANMSLGFADDSFDVSVLELPYIFGTQPGRKPVWVFLIEQIQGMKKFTLYPRGGTTMITAKQAGQCIAGALENGKGGNNYPVGYYNFTWIELLKIIHKYMGVADKKIITIPTFLYRLGMKDLVKKQIAGHQEGGLQMVEFTKLMTANCFIDKNIIVEELGVQPDDIDGAIGESVKLCLEVLKGNTEVVGMKGE
jgi:nucleoside-diphosphate-sugar epimerase